MSMLGVEGLRITREPKDMGKEDRISMELYEVAVQRDFRATF